MTRRLVLATCLVAVLGGGAGAAFADTSAPDSGDRHELCIVLAKDPSFSHTQDYCINWTGVPSH